jgi:hypothetical protein
MPIPGIKSAIGGVSGSLNLQYFTKASNASGSTITIPATAQIGDLAFLIGLDVFGAAPAPSGWDTFHSGGFGVVAAKIITSGNPGSSVTYASGGSSNNRGMMAVFRGSRPVVSFSDPAPFNFQATAGNPASQNVSPTPADEILVLAGWSGLGAVSPRTATPPVNDQQGADTRQWVGYAHRQGSSESFTFDMDDEGNMNVFTSGWLQVS